MKASRSPEGSRREFLRDSALAAAGITIAGVAGGCVTADGGAPVPVTLPSEAAGVTSEHSTFEFGLSWCGRCVTAVHTGILNRTAFSYDNAGRLDTVTALDSALSSLGSASYGYPANSRLVSQIAFTNTNTRRMLTSKSYDNLDRLTSIASATNSSAIAAISYAYGYNSANQRTAVTNSDNTFWSYQYDALGQLTAGKRRWLDGPFGFGVYGTPVAGQQFEYAFDHIGNRTQPRPAATM